MGGELFDGKLALAHQVKASLHVALGRPPSIANRIIHSLFLIKGIPPPRTEGRGNRELKLFLKERRSRDLQTHNTHKHDTPLGTTDFRSKLDGLIAFGGSRQHNGVDTEGTAEIPDGLERRAC